MLKSLMVVAIVFSGLPADAAFTQLSAPVVPEKTDKAPHTQSVVPLSEAVFPVVSTRLKPGPVATRAVALPGITPVFLIGDDPRSVQWLEARQSYLQTLNATGLVVNVATPARFRFLQQRAGGLTLLPVSGDDFAQRLGLDAYPVMVTDSEVSQ
ncbi:integrating conjugative element protein [Scandinavium sp. M-37]|uniref:integrating conjugative element protein n=1 Tax=Scandinavium sp. M-37 TaxID=3373077 RepID=UPI0037467B10